jgi:hypothetical protein
MKKSVVLGMILLALGVMAYADGVTVGLDFGRSQFNIASGSSASGAPINQGWVGPAGLFPTGQRLDMQFAWSNDKVGINITDYVTNGGSAADTIVNAYGTLKFVPDLFTVYIGEFNGDGWDHFRYDTAHPINDTNNNNVGRFGGWGAILDVMPKDSGFEVALFAKLRDPTSTGTQTIQEALSQYNVAASYTVPNTVKIGVGSTTFANAPYSNEAADDLAAQIAALLKNPALTPAELAALAAPGFSERNIFGFVQILMVPNLTAWDNIYYAGFDAPSKTTIVSNLLGLSYDMKPLTLILAGYFGKNAITGTPDYSGADYTSWAVQPEVIYNMGAMSLGLYASVAGISTSGSGIAYTVEPYVKINDFGTRISFRYSGNSASGSISTWEIPVLIDWGF